MVIIPPMGKYFRGALSAEISGVSRYYDQLIHWRPRPEDDGSFFESLEAPKRHTVKESEEFPDLTHERDRRTLVLINGEFNHHFDIQALFQEIHPKLSRTSRVMAVTYNPYMAWVYRLANRLGLRSGEHPSTFITRTDIANIARISGFEIVKLRPAGFSPWDLLGIGSLLNRILPAIPLLKWLSFTTLIMFRPLPKSELSLRPSLSILIPARNERGNIESAVRRLPDLGAELEVIFVEGNSTDGTWEEIQRVIDAYQGPHRLVAYQQTGKGKADAVRLGFKHATADLLTILDADLTMPPELLGRFYEAYRTGQADFVNGTRLVYPMEGEAMRFLNLLGNIFFAKALSHVLDTGLGDTLCGTKLVARHDYERMRRWRADFGEFDPFGDFELIFPAAILGLGIVDIPIRYRARTYGSTNISRFRHGFILLRMTLIGFFKIKLGQTR